MTVETDPRTGLPSWSAQTPPPRLDEHQKLRLRNAASRAPLVWDGPVGRLVARELLVWEKLGYLGGDREMWALCETVEAEWSAVAARRAFSGSQSAQETRTAPGRHGEAGNAPVGRSGPHSQSPSGAPKPHLRLRTPGRVPQAVWDAVRGRERGVEQ